MLFLFLCGILAGDYSNLFLPFVHSPAVSATGIAPAVPFEVQTAPFGDVVDNAELLLELSFPFLAGVSFLLSLIGMLGMPLLHEGLVFGHEVAAFGNDQLFVKSICIRAVGMVAPLIRMEPVVKDILACLRELAGIFAKQSLELNLVTVAVYNTNKFHFSLLGQVPSSRVMFSYAWSYNKFTIILYHNLHKFANLNFLHICFIIFYIIIWLYSWLLFYFCCCSSRCSSYFYFTIFSILHSFFL